MEFDLSSGTAVIQGCIEAPCRGNYDSILHVPLYKLFKAKVSFNMKYNFVRRSAEL